MQVKLHVQKMVCEGCENRLINALKEIKGVENVTANYQTEEVVVQLKNKELLEKAIQKIEDLDFLVVGEKDE